VDDVSDPAQLWLDDVELAARVLDEIEQFRVWALDNFRPDPLPPPPQPAIAEAHRRMVLQERLPQLQRLEPTPAIERN